MADLVTWWKRPAEWVLARTLGRWALGRRTGRTLILAYHNVVPDAEAGQGEASLHLRRSEFARQLELLRQSHEVVSLEDCLEGSDGRGPPRVVITFDDAYRGALTCGLREVEDRGLPATFFVAPGLLGGGRPWWDRMAEQHGGRLEPSVRERAIEELHGDEEAILGSRGEEPVRDEGLVRQPRRGTDDDLVAIGDVEDLARAENTPGITLGAHGWKHSNLTCARDGALRSELGRPLEWLRGRFDSAVPWLSYPYGRSSERVKRTASASGYRGAVRVSGGWVPRGKGVDPFSVPRVNVPAGLSLDGFRLRVSGLLEA